MKRPSPRDGKMYQEALRALHAHRSALTRTIEQLEALPRTRRDAGELAAIAFAKRPEHNPVRHLCPAA